jgi:hypothetical protein
MLILQRKVAPMVSKDSQSPDKIYKETKMALRVQVLPSRVVYPLILARKKNVFRGVPQNDHLSIGYTKFSSMQERRHILGVPPV